MPGIFAFMQNPPPITISGQNWAPASTRSRCRAPTCRRSTPGRRKLEGKMRQLPGFVDVQSDMQISSPQLMVDIDRDRALALGVTPQQVQDALFSAYSQREVSVIYAPANQYSVILEVLPQYQRTPEALSKLYLRSSSGGAGSARKPWYAPSAQTGPLQINHFGQLPAVTISFNLRPGFSARTVGASGGRRDPRPAHAGHHQRQLPGNREGVPELLPEPDGAAGRGDPGDLHRAGHSVRELHPPHHDSLRPALGGLRRAADAGAVPQGARPVRVRRHHHAVRRGEEERHHDDRFRDRRAEDRACRRTTPSGTAACCASARS